MEPTANLALSDLEDELEARGFQALSMCGALRGEERWRRMTLLPDKATSDEHDRVRADATPRESATNRLWACITDVVAFAPAVRHLHDVASRGQPRMTTAGARAWNEGTTEETVREFNEARRPAEAFIASLKAVHFLIRALQDAAYAVLFEVLMAKPCGKGKKSSMGCVLKTDLNPVRIVLDKHWPTYVPWFRKHRDLRNAFKEGVLTGWSHVPTPSGPRFVMAGGGVSLDTITEALGQSVSLMGIITEEAGRARKARTRQVSASPSV